MTEATQVYYDTTDVAYIFKGFLTKYKEDPDNEDLICTAQGDSDLDKMALMMEVAIDAAKSVAELIDFLASSSEEVWAYDHLDLDNNEDTLTLRLWHQSVLSTTPVDTVVRTYAMDHEYVLNQ